MHTHFTAPTLRGLVTALAVVGLLTACQPMAAGLGGSDTGADTGAAAPKFPPVDPDNPPADDQDALRVAEALLSGSYGEVAEQFNGPMAEAVSEAELAETTDELLDNLGSVNTIGQPGSVVHDGALVYLVPVSLNKGFAHVRIAFDGDGRITGLFLLR
jgi:hypothetical protein